MNRRHRVIFVFVAIVGLISAAPTVWSADPRLGSGDQVRDVGPVGEGDQQGQHRGRHPGCGHAVAFEKPGRKISEARRLCLYGEAGSVASDILDKFTRRSVAPLWLFSQSLENDGVQVTP